MKNALQLAAAIILLVNVTVAQSTKVPPGPLDKKVFSVETTEENKKKAEPFKDDLKFDKGKFSCKKMNEEGFMKPSPYEATYDSSATPITCSFTVDAKDDSDNTFKWDGTITFGDEISIEGTASIVNKKGKQKKSYTYSGALKGKKPVKK